MLNKNSLLEKIVTQLATVKIPDEILVEEFKKTGRAAVQAASFHGILGELHMQLALREICQPYGKRVLFQPIPVDALTERYHFQKNEYGNLAVFRKHKKQQHGEFDELLLADELPVVFESKLHRTIEIDEIPKTNKKELNQQILPLNLESNPIYSPFTLVPQKRYRGRYGAMNPEKIDHSLDPIQEYFHQKSCGYVLMVYPSQLNSPHPMQREFLRRGGILASFPKDWEEHRRETLELFKVLST